MNAMTKAHEIRKAAAEKWNCKVSEIHFGECLRMAHKGDDVDITLEQTLAEAATFSCFDRSEIEAGAEISLELVTEAGKWTVYRLTGKDSLTQGDCNRLKSNTSRITGKPAFANLRSRQLGFLNN